MCEASRASQCRRLRPCGGFAAAALSRVWRYCEAGYRPDRRARPPTRGAQPLRQARHCHGTLRRLVQRCMRVCACVQVGEGRGVAGRGGIRSASRTARPGTIVLRGELRLLRLPVLVLQEEERGVRLDLELQPHSLSRPVTASIELSSRRRACSQSARWSTQLTAPNRSFVLTPSRHVNSAAWAAAALYVGAKCWQCGHQSA